MKYLLMCNFVSAMTLELQNPSDQTCTYTFNVPRDGASCLGSHQEIRDSIETLVSNQHVLLEQQLNVIIEKLVQMEQRWDSIKENEDENVETAGAGGTTYVRWGRTSCPETASVIYQGKTGYIYTFVYIALQKQLSKYIRPLKGLYYRVEYC